MASDIVVAWIHNGTVCWFWISEHWYLHFWSSKRTECFNLAGCFERISGWIELFRGLGSVVGKLYFVKYYPAKDAYERKPYCLLSIRHLINCLRFRIPMTSTLFQSRPQRNLEYVSTLGTARGAGPQDESRLFYSRISFLQFSLVDLFQCLYGLCCLVLVFFLAECFAFRIHCGLPHQRK
jgi:hypothetical protein